MDCPELKKLMDQSENGLIPRHLKAVIEAHLDTCRSCSAKLAGFMKIEDIIGNTVYGAPSRDKYLRFLSHEYGQELNWAKPYESLSPGPTGGRRLSMLLIKVLVGFLVAAAAGISGVLVLGRSGCIGRQPQEKQLAEAPLAERDAGIPIPAEQDSAPAPAPSAGRNEEPTINLGSLDKMPVLPVKLDPESIYQRINSRRETSTSPPPPPSPARTGEPVDSSRLKTLEAELAALRDARSRTPKDRSLIKRTMEKHRQVMAEKRRLDRPARARDYFNLGYLHYLNQEYPQTAIVTEEGLKMVRIEPTEYLHYLKAMSHFRIAEQAIEPLPADTSGDNAARLAGARLRAELDTEGKKQAINQLRQAIMEFNQLQNNPELKDSANEWILKCSNMIEELMGSG
ncbi:MAG: hypothetical protein U9P14_04560 [Gemmatimonadota bacterium]|nr:hypothetical protein [Gemmatimonadota bacterium]